MVQLKKTGGNFNSMNPDKFSTIQRKQLLHLGDDGYAFIPAPLPPELNYVDLIVPLTDASATIGELNGAARRLQNPHILIGPLQRREALTSSAMEGTITTLGDIILEEAGDKEDKNENAREAFNYAVAVAESTKRLKQIPISHRLIKDAHKMLLSGLGNERGANKRPGEYKINQNAVGQQGDTINMARYVPPPPKETQTCMDLLEAYINRKDVQPAYRLIDLALIHYQFEAIHPFDDGNGRIGRMLITLMAIQYKLLDLPLLHVSIYLEKQKDEYIDKMFGVSAKGAWTEWVVFFLETVEACARDAISIVDKIIDLQAKLRQQSIEVGKSPRLPMIVDSLFSKTWTTVPQTQEICGVSFPTAQADLSALVKAGILRELGTLRPRIYYSPEILALSDRPQS